MIHEGDMANKPHWEHGYRCHGYWLGLERLARVSLPPRGTKPMDYGWCLDDYSQEGRTDSLRKAKRIIERLIARGVLNETTGHRDDAGCS